MGIEFQSVLIGLLIIAVVALSIILFVRIRSDKRKLASIRQLDHTQFCELLSTNSLDGSIQNVAGKVSDLLITTCGCESIIFVRKRRGLFELNYYHNVKGFNRSDFKFLYSRDLAIALCVDFHPRKIEELNGLLPEKVFDELSNRSINICFPIFWRDNLYGIYFVKSKMAEADQSFGPLVSSLAQSLSAAYHVKWHESKLERSRRPGRQIAGNAYSNNSIEGKHILHLVKNRNSQSIVRDIFHSVRAETGLKHAALFYEGKDHDLAPRLLHSDQIPTLSTIDQTQFDHLIKELSQNKFIKIEEASPSKELATIYKKLTIAGLDNLVLFPLSPERCAILAWSKEGGSKETAQSLYNYRDTVQALIQNAESFEEAEELSYTDALTGLSNQRYFRKRLTEEIDRAKRYNRSLAFIIFDMDDLKGINDSHGHQAGDAVIRRMGQILRSSIRAIDIIARYGGDEFCVIMPEADGATCERFMHRLQDKISQTLFTTGISQADLNCTISLGGAVYPEHASEAEQLVYAADMALLKAKDAGRNSAWLYSATLASETD